MNIQQLTLDKIGFKIHIIITLSQRMTTLHTEIL